MAAEARIGLRKPSAASGIAATLYPNAHARLRRMVRNVARASLIASGTAPRSSRSRIRSAAQIATSVPGPEGQPEVGRGERGGVVDAVADHRHPVPCRLKTGDDGGLVGWQRPGDDLVDARRGRDGPGGRLVVPGQQDRAQPERAQFGDGRGRGRLDRVGDRDARRAPRRPSRPAPRCGRPAPTPGTARPVRRGRSSPGRRAASPARRPPRGRRRCRARRVQAGPGTRRPAAAARPRPARPR